MNADKALVFLIRVHRRLSAAIFLYGLLFPKRGHRRDSGGANDRDPAGNRRGERDEADGDPTVCGVGGLRRRNASRMS